MLFKFSCLITLALTSASPFHQVSQSHERRSFPYDGLIDRSTNVGRRAEASVGNSTIAGLIPSNLNLPTNIEDIDFDRPFANAALWQEALAYDKEKGVEKLNQMAYGLVAYFQAAENSARNPWASAGYNSSLISQGLEAINMYPAQFNQHQADDPKESLGKPEYSDIVEFDLLD